ncbi:hypothetical protein CEXT_348941, partial [Caerostris extrusa]
FPNSQNPSGGAPNNNSTPVPEDNDDDLYS